MEFDSIFNISNKLYSIIGFNITSISSPKSLKEWVTLIFKICIGITLGINYFITALFLLIYIKQNSHDQIKVFEAVVNLDLLIFLSVKTIIILWRQKDIRNIIEKLRDTSKATEKTKYFQKNLEFFNRFQILSLILFVSTFLGFMFGCIIENIPPSPTGKNLIYKQWMPFDYQPISIYIVTNIWVSVVALSSMALQIASEGIFYGLIIILSSQFHDLAEDFEQFDCKDDVQGLKNLVVRYQELLKISTDIESTFSLSNFLTFIDSSLMMCFTILQVFMKQGQWFRYHGFASFFGIILSHIFFYCYYCQKLQTANSLVGEKILMTNWYESKSRDILRMVQMTAMKSQESIHLTAMGFTIITMDTFTNVSWNQFSVNFK